MLFFILFLTIHPVPLVILQPGHSPTIKIFFTKACHSGQEEVMLPLPVQQKNQETEGEE